MIENLKFDYIDATLKHGYTFSSKVLKAFFILMYVLFALELVCFMGMLIGICFAGDGCTEDDIITFSCGGSISTVIFVGVLLFNLWVHSHKKKIDLWLEDAVLLDAEAMSLDGMTVESRSRATAIVLKVTFKYNGKRYTRQSVNKDEPHYSTLYKKYARCEQIKIAYSPKYDEVMLIMPECEHCVCK